MKKFFLLAAFVTGAALAGAALPDPPHMPKRLPKVFRTGKTALVLNGKNAHIVVAPKAFRSTRFAAKELAELLEGPYGNMLPNTALGWLKQEVQDD